MVIPMMKTFCGLALGMLYAGWTIREDQRVLAMKRLRTSVVDRGLISKTGCTVTIEMEDGDEANEVFELLMEILE